ncbi:BRCA2, oligonucleotide/oligosaccharide-binding, domain 1-domain-containing protein [Auriculariales sp. MPI-PUGE-AT-0066]|nr:BRCA2, oligonucleotide/oligosaccharide-binding, domain 1-domain-containing protein [Auriculariales sp. MPI-PUGE-AT-0066]
MSPGGECRGVQFALLHPNAMPRDAYDSDTASPARKRQRLSSPSDYLGDSDIDSDTLAALDEIERTHTQQRQLTQARAASSRKVMSPSRSRPQASKLFTKASSVTNKAGFSTAPVISRASTSRSPSPDAPEEQNYDDWFTASQHTPANASASFSFLSGRAPTLSAAALEQAAAKFRSWDEDVHDETSSTPVLKAIGNVDKLTRPLGTPKPSSIPHLPFVFASQQPGNDQAAAPPATPARQLPSFTRPTGNGSALQTPRLPSSTPRSNASHTRPQFRTPFKNSSNPTTLGLSQSVSRVAHRTPVYPATKVTHPSPTTTKPAALPSLPQKLRKRTLTDSGIQPGDKSQEELEELGLPAYIFQINVRTAQYFAFDSDVAPASLGAKAAFDHFQTKGCKSASLEWVENHWRLILWKLSGMVIHDPDPLQAMKNRWNWEEMLKQLQYRYTREFVDGARPALRAVLERDAHAAAPMTLCVAGIQWRESQQLEDGSYSEPSAELELTDGWYFVQAHLDTPLTHAIRRNIIKVGRKIACAGAKLETPHQDGKDVFTASRSCSLTINGNSTSLAPWHAKLGFHASGFTSGLRSLTPDGGIAALIDVVVVRPFAMGFIEMHADGTKDGPYDQSEERDREEKWTLKRDRERSRIVDGFQRRMQKAESILEKLHRIARSFVPGDYDEMPDDTEDVYEEILEDSTRIKSLSASDAGWMAIFLRGKNDQERDQLPMEIESELASECPARNVRNFMVVRVRDTVCVRRPTTRTAQLTVWDALQVGKDTFNSGVRLQISNVATQQAGSWTGANEADSEIFLTTRKTSKIQKMYRDVT